MHFEIVEDLSFPQPYKAINEDAYFCSDNLVVVIDGATGLGPAKIPGVQSDAAWFSHSLVGELKACWAKDADFPSVLEHCLKRLRAQWVRLTGQPDLGPLEMQPLAAMTAVQLKGSEAHFFRLGDCSSFVQHQGQGCSVFQPSPLAEVDAKNLAWMVKNRKEGMSLESVLKMSTPRLLTTRSDVNKPNGVQVLSLDGAGVKSMDHFAMRLDAKSGGLEFVLTSDGFSALIDDYFPQLGESTFTKLCTKSLSATYNLLRDVERTDPLGFRFPRFKKHDDATAVRVRLNAA